MGDIPQTPVDTLLGRWTTAILCTVSDEMLMWDRLVSLSSAIGITDVMRSAPALFSIPLIRSMTMVYAFGIFNN